MAGVSGSGTARVAVAWVRVAEDDAEGVVPLTKADIHLR
jgi:hypothetical protein